MSSDIQRALVQRVSVLETIETQFSQLLLAGQLNDWALADLKDAVTISQQHKLAAIAAIERQELLQAINNIDTIIYLISGFVEEHWELDDLSLN